MKIYYGSIKFCFSFGKGDKVVLENPLATREPLVLLIAKGVNGFCILIIIYCLIKINSFRKNFEHLFCFIFGGVFSVLNYFIFFGNNAFEEVFFNE